MDKSINDESYVAIQGWMITRLNLKGNELMIYAIIYGFTQIMGDQWFTGSRQYLADWTNTSRPSVDKALKSLVDKGLINKHEKIINNIKFVEYQITEESLQVGKNLYMGCKETLQGDVKKLYRGCKETLHNNIDNILDNNIENNNKKEKEEKENDNPAELKAKKTNFDEIISDYTDNPELQQALQDFIKMRKAIKSVITDRALKSICSKLDTLAKTSEEKIQILDQSIMNSWKGVFPLKEGSVNGQTYERIVRPDTQSGGRADYHITEGLI